MHPRVADAECRKIIAGLGLESCETDIDGVAIHYVCAGNGEPLVLLHGFGAWVYAWRYQFKGLSRRFRILAVDLKGFGLSTRSLKTSYSIDAHVRAVLKVLDAEGIESAIWMGNSFGGTVAMKAAIDAPERVQQLVLLAAPFRIEIPPLPRLLFVPFLGPWLARRKLFTSNVVMETMRYNYANHAIINSDAVNAYLAPLHRRNTAEVWLRMIRQIRNFDMSDELPRIQQRTLLIWGERDKTVPVEMGEQLRKHLPRVEWLLLRNIGHAPHEECPHIVNTALIDFLSHGMGNKFHCIASTC